MKSEWDGLPDNKFASQQCFGLVFPKDLDLEHKNLLIGAAFLMVSFFPVFKNINWFIRATTISVWIKK